MLQNHAHGSFTDFRGVGGLVPLAGGVSQRAGALAAGSAGGPGRAFGGGAGGANAAERRRVKSLERELRRKDKALAEAAALAGRWFYLYQMPQNNGYVERFNWMS